MSDDYSLESSNSNCDVNRFFFFFFNLGGANSWVIFVVTEILKVD